jgi:plasmid replication initiation protein
VINLNDKKLYKPRSLIFCKDKTNNKERLIYNYLLYKLREDKKNISIEKEKLEELDYKYKGHNLKITFKELRQHLNLTKKTDIIKMFDNLRNADIEEHSFNFGRKNKSSFKAKLIGDIKEYNKEDGFFELTFSPLIVDLILFQNNDYTQLFLEELKMFKSKYSLVIYEILKASYIPYFNYNQSMILSLNDFKSILNVENYNISNLKQRVLKKAKEDIESLTDYKFDYELINGDVGKRFEYIKLIFDTKSTVKRSSYIENKKVKNLTQKELIFLLKKEMPENLLISQLEKENKELSKITYLQTRKAEMAIDELNSIHLNNLEEDYQDSELCF